MLEQWLEQLDELLSSGKLGAAEAFLKETLAELELRGEASSGASLSLLNELASLYRGTSRLEEAEAAFLRVEDILQDTGQKLSLAFVAVQINLAGCYRLMGRAEAALSRYAAAQEGLCALKAQDERAQGALSDAEGETERPGALSDAERERLAYLTASVLNNISLLYNDLGNYDQALEYAEQAAEMIGGGVGDDHELATTFNNLASVYLKLNRFEEAEEAVEEALAIYARMPRENVHHAAALSTEAALLFRRGEFDAAEAALERSAALTEHFFGHNSEYETVQRSLQTLREARQRSAAASSKTTDFT
ncbi:MAG: tetratricopeptide repeat protein [Coriobacteriales bacterium]|jgi:tetratricopeptide (TPR) repeat protein|nr:tetratricopeptide repeat protein [Coriobacteriales bacterium]